ncbi:hypothetical protein M2323_001985 [Rhodoblastus acidophilus]|uniref:hypothetical protein n=1 Tax=Rhodoblastus acidophilus TaxID=1074 RepID=UPI002224F658|nr:hypothetical protein [Rhodoblastus acidophilus]MCW2285691.1 hypothetical protein [Rhodoblastus acidophilus]MCW2333063.1 hypothetical protein [Rhodoblastus acidophilus]
MNIRMLPPTDVRYQSRTFCGRIYTGAPGVAIDVVDFDAAELSANGWVWIAPSGPTSSRPAGALGPYPAAPGVHFFDTTLNALIVFDGATWRNPATGTAV